MKAGMKRCSLVFLLVYLTVVFTGCHFPAKESQESTEGEREEREYAEVLQQEWQSPSKDAGELTGWAVVEYVPDVMKLSGYDANIEAVSVSMDEQNGYELLCYETQEDEEIKYGYALKIIDLRTMEQRERISLFSPVDFEGKLDAGLADSISMMIEQGYAKAMSMDIIGEEIRLFLSVWNETWEIQHFYLISMMTDGTIEQVTDYIDCVWPDRKSRTAQFNVPEVFFGTHGNIYLLDQQEKTIRTMSEDGEILAYFELGDMTEERIVFAGRSQSGTCVFYVSMKKNEKMFFNIDGERMNTLWKGTLEAVDCRLDPYGNVLMFQGGDRLMSWNVLTGEINCLYQFTGLSGWMRSGIARNTEGEIILWYGRYEDGFVYKLNDFGTMEIRELVLLQRFQNQYTAACAAEYTRTHPNVRIKVEQMENQDGMEWNRLAADVKKGEGPDLFLIDRKQLNILQDAEVLTPLSELISEDIKSNVFAGALKFGDVEGELYALPVEASLGTWMINRDYLENDDWTLKGVMSAYESWKKQNTRAERFESVYYRTSSTQLLYDLCLQSVENSEFVDFDTMKCNFESENFLHLLRFCRDNGENSEGGEYLTQEETMKEVLDGKAFLYYVGGGLPGYSQARSDLGDQFIPIGYPSKDKAINMVHCYEGVAINNLSENKDIAVDFLLYLLSEENQCMFTTYWLRKDVLTEHVKDRYGEDEQPVFQQNLFSVVPLPGRADGSSYLDEYMVLMDAGEPLSVQYAIQDIVIEEAAAYFMGDKTETEVAEVIQNRVQNYLNEQ